MPPCSNSIPLRFAHPCHTQHDQGHGAHKNDNTGGQDHAQQDADPKKYGTEPAGPSARAASTQQKHPLRSTAVSVYARDVSNVSDSIAADEQANSVFDLHDTASARHQFIADAQRRPAFQITVADLICNYVLI